ncbi:MAG: hypothetical protein M3O35_13420 [Acidobacteriota bacterium]|nr:hypothetical protein [Acidobacteriota bacterium]
MTFVLALFLAFADLSAVKAEPDSEKRSEAALDFANDAIDQARTAYSGGDVARTQAALAAVQESVELSYESLRASGKKPRKSKYYKHAEQKIHAMLRRLHTLREAMAVEDRPAVDPAIKKLQDINEEVLSDVMTKK